MPESPDLGQPPAPLPEPNDASAAVEVELRADTVWTRAVTSPGAAPGVLRVSRQQLRGPSGRVGPRRVRGLWASGDGWAGAPGRLDAEPGGVSGLLVAQPVSQTAAPTPATRPAAIRAFLTSSTQGTVDLLGQFSGYAIDGGQLFDAGRGHAANTAKPLK